MYLIIPNLVITSLYKRSPIGIVANVLNCNIMLSEFKLWSHYYVYFQTNTLGKGINLFIPLYVIKWRNQTSQHSYWINIF